MQFFNSEVVVARRCSCGVEKKKNKKKTRGYAPQEFDKPHYRVQQVRSLNENSARRSGAREKRVKERERKRTEREKESYIKKEKER